VFASAACSRDVCMSPGVAPSCWMIDPNCLDREFGPFFLKFCSYFPYITASTVLPSTGSPRCRPQKVPDRHRPLISPGEAVQFTVRLHCPAALRSTLFSVKRAPPGEAT
jgi:hypothetical protein